MGWNWGLYAYKCVMLFASLCRIKMQRPENHYAVLCELCCFILRTFFDLKDDEQSVILPAANNSPRT